MASTVPQAETLCPLTDEEFNNLPLAPVDLRELVPLLIGCTVDFADMVGGFTPVDGLGLYITTKDGKKYAVDICANWVCLGDLPEDENPLEINIAEIKQNGNHV